jgi:hypothetical protein
MDEMHDFEALAARMERLERTVEELARRLPAAEAGPAAHASAAPALPPRVPVRAAAAVRVPREAIRWDGQLWLNRLGIGLLLLGVALLFRYSIDMGWITPAVRVGFGTAVGVTLLAAGLRIGEKRRFGSVLVGGGIAVFYIVGWAAFNLYSLVGYTAAFAGAVAVTALAFWLALRKDEPALGILGAIGGLGTPLLLGLSYGTPRGLAIYTCIIIGWTAALHVKRSWRWVLWTTLAFGWVLLCRYAYHVALPDRLVAADAWVLQGAAVFAWACTGLLPLLVRLRLKSERRWSELDAMHWYGVALVPPGAALLVTGLVWTLPGERWGAARWRFGALRRVRLPPLDTRPAAGAGARARRVGDADGGDDRRAEGERPAGRDRGAVAGASRARGEGRRDRAALDGAQGVHRRGGVAAHPPRRGLRRGAGELVHGGGGAGVRARGVVPRAPAPGDARLPLLRARRAALLPVARAGADGRRRGLRDGGVGRVRAGAAPLRHVARPPAGGEDGARHLLVVVAKLFLVDLAALEAIYRILLFPGIRGVFLFFSYALQTWLRPRAASRPAPRVAG